ncbi:hypothetical protein HRI_004355500 [Hibiscus trionum]|uniref:DUF4283 domain-containing protein n=1 Tax=Hibiscus trionum TaxID=183268 RepID=A0A9W7MJF7_HIBTR|nr:hypothetical protein HRI_004355500 [Hibiscus trionum]
MDQLLSVFPPAAEKNGRTLVQPPHAVLIDGAKQWDNALIGNFFGKSPPLGVFQKTTNRPWGQSSRLGVGIGDLAHSTEGDRSSEMSPGLLLEVLNLDSAPVWVRLWHVPLELYSQQGYGYLASALSKPLYTDKAIVLKQQLEFAKVCVNVDAKSVLPSSILVDLGNDNIVDVMVELVWSPLVVVIVAFFVIWRRNVERRVSP